MKKNVFVIVVLMTLFVNVKQANAQFTGLKKKNGASIPAATPNNTNNTAIQNTPSANVNTGVSTNTTSVVNKDQKPSKTIDTALPGAFNANRKRSLKNGYAFFSETKKRTSLQERIPLPYQNLREEDAMFSEFVWEEIDGREKINRPFIYQAYDDNGDQRFFAILMRAIEKDSIVPFSATEGGDRFTTPLTIDDVNSVLKGSLDTIMVQNADNPNIYDTSVVYNTKLAPLPDSIYTFRLKEQYIFDNKTSRMYCRIIGIAPIANIVINNKVERKTLFWLYYPDLRPVLAKYEVYNPKNISNRITWEELFESRYFNGSIVKSTFDNYNDLMLSALYKDPIRRLQEGEKIRQRIFDYEQELWVY
jgi:gliding motility associated protien GldN